MPIYNLLRPGLKAPVLLADIVFEITHVNRDGVTIPRPTGHAGLVGVPKPQGHGLGDAIVVYHMTNDFIRREPWADRQPEGNRADIVGSTALLEEGVRRNIIDRAVGYCHSPPSKLSPSSRSSCYWLGDYNPSRHPLNPSAENAYAFSCTTFVFHCYYQNGLILVPLEELPFLAPEDRSRFIGWGLHVQPGNVRRLCCGHLISALEREPEQFPFRPPDGNWGNCSDQAKFAALIAASSAVT